MTNEYARDKAADSIADQTKRRRAGRFRRKRLIAVTAVTLICLFVLSVPSFVSHSPMGRSLVTSALGKMDLDSDIDSIRIGWVTPLRVTGLRVQGRHAGSQLSVEQIDGPMTIMDVLLGRTSDLGKVTVRGVDIRCSIANGKSSIEEDFASFFEPSDQSTTGKIHVQDLKILAADESSKTSWMFTQANANLDLESNRTTASLAGVVVGPDQDSGSIQTSVVLTPNADSSTWQVSLDTESLPLSLLTLVRSRFPDAMESLPSQFAGDASGAVRIMGTSDGLIDTSITAMEIRNLIAADPQNPERIWRNSHAEIDGDLTIADDRIIGNELTASTDFASATLNGAFSRSLTFVGAQDNPLKWLDGLDGIANAEVDLAAFQQALPGVLPIKQDAEILSGRTRASIRSSKQGNAQSQLTVTSEPLRFRSRGRAVVIDPVDFRATVTNDQGVLRADQFELTSSFATAIGHGTLRSGVAKVGIDFGRLSAMLRPLVELSDARLSGIVNGDLTWAAAPNNVWKLDGTGSATNLWLSLPGGKEVRGQSVDGKLAAVGRWSGQRLQELSAAELSVTSPGLEITARLARAVPDAEFANLIPLQITAKGQLETVGNVFGPWMPSDLAQSKGVFEVSTLGKFAYDHGSIQNATINLANADLHYQDLQITQRTIRCSFDGDYAWPSGDLVSRATKIVGEAATIQINGELTSQRQELTIGWATELQQLQNAIQQLNVQNMSISNGSRPVGGTYQWMGQCEGSTKLVGKGDQWHIETDCTGRQMAIVQPRQVGASTGAPLPSRFGPLGNATAIWSEPNLRISGLTRYDPQLNEWSAEQLKITTDWLATTLVAKASFGESGLSVVANGPTKLAMSDVSQKISELTGTRVDLRGNHTTPLKLQWRQPNTGATQFQIQGNLGWDSGSVANVSFGPATIPLTIDEALVQIQPAIIPIGQGQLNLAGTVHYATPQRTIRLRPGVLARDIRMTPEMTDVWIKYLAPLAADATQIDGAISVEVDEAELMIDQLANSRIRGRVGILGAEMRTGRLSNQILSAIDQLKAIADVQANAFGAQPTNVATGKTLIAMPAQTVEFSFADGMTHHQRLYFEIDRAQVITSGSVNVNGALNVTAQVPLDASWLGRDLKELAGQTVALPINGTLSQPRLDPRGISQVVTQLGTQAVQGEAKNFLEDQLNKGIDKILGR